MFVVGESLALVCICFWIDVCVLVLVCVVYTSSCLGLSDARGQLKLIRHD